MKPAFLLLFLLATQIFCCCTHDNEQQAGKAVTEVKARKSSKTIKLSAENTDTTRQIHEHVGSILSYREPLKSRKDYTTSFKNEVSSYNKTVIDTILTLSKGKNNFTYYNSSSKEAVGEAAPMNFTIETDKVYLPDSIHVMMTRKELIDKLKLSPFNGRLRITEEEGYQQLYFTFRRDTVVRIAFESSYMD